MCDDYLTIPWFLRRDPEEAKKEQDMCDECVAICNAIGELNADEASGVNILSANADFDGPNNVIEVTAEWTNWQSIRYEGNNVREALEKAVEEKRLNI